jgi:hypothetical protein
VEAACITTVTCGTITAFTSARILTTVRDRLCTVVRFTRGRRQTGISGRGIVPRHLDFGHRRIDHRPLAAGLPAVEAVTSHRQTAAGLPAAAAETNRRPTVAPDLPAVAEANHPPAITEVDGLPAMALAQDRPAMAVPLDRPHNRRRVPPVLPPAILTRVFRKGATGHRLSDRLLNRIREPVQAALTAASAENPSVRRVIAAKQAPEPAIARGESSDEIP